MATFPEDEYERRAQSAGEAERMTKESLQFARQGGIAAYRYRNACQICPSPSAEETDLALGLIGLPVQEYFLLMAKSQELSDRLGLETLSIGPAPESSLAQRRHAIEALKARRDRKGDRVLSSLPPGLPEDVAELLDHLRSCQPCRDCLDACPTCMEVLELAAANTKPLLEAAEHWVVLCSGCGMCDQACPRGYPLNAVIRRLARSLLPESLAA
jgi:ferredoxin